MGPIAWCSRMDRFVDVPQGIDRPQVIFPLGHDDTAFSNSLNMFCTALITLALAP